MNALVLSDIRKYSQHIVQFSHLSASSKAEGTPQSETNVDLLYLYLLSSNFDIFGILVILLLCSCSSSRLFRFINSSGAAPVKAL